MKYLAYIFAMIALASPAAAVTVLDSIKLRDTDKDKTLSLAAVTASDGDIKLMQETPEDGLDSAEVAEGEEANFLETGLPTAAEHAAILEAKEGFRTNVFEPIKKSFDHSQKELGNWINRSTNLSKETCTLLNISRFLDFSFDNCSSKTNESRAVYDECKIEEEETLQAKHEACNLSGAASPATYNVSMRYRMVEFDGYRGLKKDAIQCNFSTFKLVQHPMESCTDYVRHLSYLARVAFHDQESHFRSLHRVCKNKTTEYETVVDRCVRTHDLWARTREQCITDHGRLNMARCTFEHQYMARCRELTTFDEIVLKVKEQEKVRKTRYEQVKFADCFLAPYGQENNASAQFCANSEHQTECAFNTTGVYEDEVGLMDYFHSTRHRLDEECGLKCSGELPISLGWLGENEGHAGPKSSGYFVSYTEKWKTTELGTVVNATGHSLCEQPGVVTGRITPVENNAGMWF